MAKQRAVIEKIKKLLALSDLEKNSNINEALNAACVAQGLMDRYRLSYEKIMFEVNGFNTKQDEILDYIKHFGTYFGMPNPPDWSRALVKIIAEHNECQCYSTKVFSSSGSDPEQFDALSIIGREENMLAVEELYFYLELEISKICIKEWAKTESIEDAESSRRWRTDFCLGAVAKLQTKFNEMKKEREKEWASSAENQYAIIRLEKKKEELQTFFSNLKLEKRDMVRATNIVSFGKGYRAAEKIPIQLEKANLLEV